ncbi:MAG: hypothetical protein QW613_05990, partial [Thermoprotei archaeon]
MGEDTLKSVKAVDCHAHISNAEFESDRDSVVKECADRGILVVDSALSIRELETSLRMGDASHWVKTTAGWEARNLD